MYLLDTNVISELRKAKSGKADQRVLAWAQSVPASSLYISAITVLELENGMPVVTRNIQDFAPTGVELLNPWEYQR